jgi:hypothetical protein
MNAILPEDEVCNDLDDDCDGQIDEGLNGDVYEPNQLCDQAFELPSSHNNEPSQVIDGLSLYEGTGLLDQDWFKWSSTDAFGVCVPSRPQCLDFNLDWIVPQGQAPSDFNVCIHFLDDLSESCNPTQVECTQTSDLWTYDEEERRYRFNHQWSGRCGLDDSRHWALEVGSLISMNACRPYTFRLRTELANQECSE